MRGRKNSNNFFCFALNKALGAWEGALVPVEGSAWGCWPPLCEEGSLHGKDDQREGLGMSLPAREVVGPCGRRCGALLWGGSFLGVLCARGEEQALAGLPLPCLLVTCAFLLPL